MKRKKRNMRLEQAINEKEITAEHLSQITGISNVTISKLRNQRNLPNTSTATLIANALDVRVEDIFNEVYPEKSA